MPFTAKSGKFNASINTVEFGTGDKAVKIGGENVFPLYSFDAAIENAPKVGIEITDFGMEHEPECIKNIMKVVLLWQIWPEKQLLWKV